MQIFTTQNAHGTLHDDHETYMHTKTHTTLLGPDRQDGLCLFVIPFTAKSLTAPQSHEPDCIVRELQREKTYVGLWNPLPSQPKDPAKSLPPSKVNNTCGHLSLFFIIAVFTNLIVDAVCARTSSYPETLRSDRWTDAFQVHRGNWDKSERKSETHPSRTRYWMCRWLKRKLEEDETGSKIRSRVLSSAMGENTVWWNRNTERDFCRFSHRQSFFYKELRKTNIILLLSQRDLHKSCQSVAETAMVCSGGQYGKSIINMFFFKK